MAASVMRRLPPPSLAVNQPCNVLAQIAARYQCRNGTNRATTRTCRRSETSLPSRFRSALDRDNTRHRRIHEFNRQYPGPYETTKRHRDAASLELDALKTNMQFRCAFVFQPAFNKDP